MTTPKTPEVVYVVTQGSSASFDKLTLDDCVDSVVGVAGCLEDAQALAQRNVEQLVGELTDAGEEPLLAELLVWTRDPDSSTETFRALSEQLELVFQTQCWDKEEGGVS